MNGIAFQNNVARCAECGSELESQWDTVSEEAYLSCPRCHVDMDLMGSYMVDGTAVPWESVEQLEETHDG